jgi:hypothetical protein
MVNISGNRLRLDKDDLNQYMRNKLDEAYERRIRPRASREDFADGYLAAVEDFFFDKGMSDQVDMFTLFLLFKSVHDICRMLPKTSTRKSA